MSPWDEMEYFDRPIPTYVDCPTGTTVVIGTDPRRVFLQITNPTSLPLTAEPTDATASLASGKGWFIDNRTPPLQLSQRYQGALCQYQWCIHNASATTVTVQVLQLQLKRWPGAT